MHRVRVDPAGTQDGELRPCKIDVDYFPLLPYGHVAVAAFAPTLGDELRATAVAECERGVNGAQFARMIGNTRGVDCARRAAYPVHREIDVVDHQIEHHANAFDSIRSRHASARLDHTTRIAMFECGNESRIEALD